MKFRVFGNSQGEVVTVEHTVWLDGVLGLMRLWVGQMLFLISQLSWLPFRTADSVHYPSMN
jgi:hypothetical protein